MIDTNPYITWMNKKGSQQQQNMPNPCPYLEL